MSTDLFNTKKEVSESAFEYLLGEILSLNLPNSCSFNDQQAATNRRLERIGYDVGFRMNQRLSISRRFLITEPLDIIKFICKELWEEIFKKKIDKLQTNHKGIFVLTDENFKWLEKFLSDDINSKKRAETIMILPCGILRGVLASFGFNSVVTVDFNGLKSCTFNIRIKS